MKKYKYPAILLPLCVVMVALIIVISTTFGWYTTVKKTGHINANTKNAGFNYKINGETLEIDEYYISNLAFFDIDSIYEGRHFNQMVYEIELLIENVTDTPMGYSVKFEGDKLFRTDASNNPTSISYAACVISPTRLGYALTSDDEAKANKNYYTYDENTHVYTQDEEIAEGDEILSTDKLYDFNSSYIPAVYVKTNDEYVKSYKTYYEKNGNSYKPTVTKGNLIKNEEGSYYEEKYVTANGTEYSSSEDYFNKVESTSGTFYIKLASDAINSTNYTNYYIGTDTYELTTDALFQNQTYYSDSTGTVAYTTLSPGTNDSINNLYEKGGRVDSLIVDTANVVSYAPNYGSEDSFYAEYLNGHLDKKDDTNDSQMVYLYIFGVQEIDSAKNLDFIELTHTFKIMINAKTDSNWDVVENENNGS